MEEYLEKRLKNIIDKCITDYLDRQSVIEAEMISELTPICEYFDHSIRGFYTGCLNEVRSLPKGYKTMVSVVLEKVKEYINNHKYVNKQGYRVWEMNFDESIFKDTEVDFFHCLDMTITMVQFDRNADSDKMSRFVGGKCSTDTRLVDDKLDKVKIAIQCPFVENKINEYLEGEILHEFTHAYQDFKIRQDNFKNGKRTMTNQEYADDVYSKYTKFACDSADECKRIVGNIFYYLSRTEQNAYAAQMYGDLSSLSYDFIRETDTMAILVKLKTWREFMRIREQLNILKYRYSNKPYLAKYINELCYHKKFYKPKDAFKWLDNQYKLTEIRMIKKLNNVIRQYLLDKYDGMRQIKPSGCTYNTGNPNEGKWMNTFGTDKNFLY